MAGRLRFVRFVSPDGPGCTNRLIAHYPIQPRHKLCRNRLLPGKFDKRLLDYVFRAVAQLPSVKFQWGSMKIEQSADLFWPYRHCQVAIFAVHNKKTPAGKVYPAKRW